MQTHVHPASYSLAPTQPATLTPWLITFAPHLRPCGGLLDPRATTAAQAAVRKTETVYAPTSQTATDRFEREQQRLVTGCRRLDGQAYEVVAGRRVTGRALAAALPWLAAGALALMLAGLGPWLDADLPPGAPSYAGYGYTPAPAPSLADGELARLEADARRRCAATHGREGGYVLLPDGAIRCSDHRGRSVITILSHGGAQ
ncbi:MAG: hypothetical protein AB7I35_01440 [Ramlibacter sp.]